MSVEKYFTAEQATRQYGTCDMHAGYFRLQIHIQSM